MANYEQSIVNALKSCFDDVRRTGCRFHFDQAIKIKAVELQSEYVYKKMREKIYFFLYAPRPLSSRGNKSICYHRCAKI